MANRKVVNAFPLREIVDFTSFFGAFQDTAVGSITPTYIVSSMNPLFCWSLPFQRI